MTRPFCSVRIDAYNHEGLIEPAIVSVLVENASDAEREIIVGRRIERQDAGERAKSLRREAIVNTPTDAVRTFFSSGMDALVIGSNLVGK